MRFLVDAQLPARLAHHLRSTGHDALHTTDLPDGNRTTDAALAAIADRQDRVLTTKDLDFRDGHLLRGSPARLLLVATGNISNAQLMGLIDAHAEALVAALDVHAFVELRADALVVHTGG
jgi:predicted nuclease of predicted toxin-antitoxin system